MSQFKAWLVQKSPDTPGSPEGNTEGPGFILFTESCWSPVANQQLAISMLGKKLVRVTTISQAEENKGHDRAQKPGSVSSTGVIPESVFIFNVVPRESCSLPRTGQTECIGNHGHSSPQSVPLGYQDDRSRSGQRGLFQGEGLVNEDTG